MAKKAKKSGKNETVPYSISATPAIAKLRRQKKQLTVLKNYAKGKDRQEVEQLILSMQRCIKDLAANCPNGLFTSVKIKKADLKKVMGY
jgi:hypothetical protein